MQSILERRGVRRIIHFHCDHFEPFRKDKTGVPIGLVHVKRWNEDRLKLPQGRNVSLFFSSQRYCYVNAPHENDHARKQRLYPVHDLYFDNTTFAQEEEDLLDFLAEQPDLDFHMHLHHEWWTSSKCTGWPVDEDSDYKRIEAVLTMYMDHMCRHIPFNRGAWGFVHGCWSLNASDRSICNLTNEILLLQKLGCFGDFSFPAGRPWCDPQSIKTPFTVVPFAAEHCYDKSEADPAIVGMDSRAWEPSRFLIWSASTPSGNLSLDAIALGQATQNPGEIAKSWLSTSPVINGTMYIKTHCHSLHDVWNSSSDYLALICGEHAQNAFSIIQGACNSYGAELRHCTVSEMMRALNEEELP